LGAISTGGASTRSGGPIAAAYATLRHLGDEGYLRLAEALQYRAYERRRIGTG
jgi:glutamate/tyrosine decarboxylase-like PLP-dependent enzyme